MALHFNFVDLQLLIHVADTGSMGRGAERCFLSPPAATKRIKMLEEALSVKLMYRNPHGVSLTPAGQVFVQHARTLFAHVERLHDDMQAFASGLKGHIRLWTNTTAVTEFLPDVLATFMARQPDVNVELRERLSYEIVKAVEEGVADIGIVAGNVSTENLEVLPFREYNIVMVCPLNHRLAEMESIAFVSTLDFDYVGLSQSSAIHKFLAQAAEVLGGRLKLRVEVGSFEGICRLVEAGVGVSVIPASVAERMSKTTNIRVVPLQDEWAWRKLRICVRSMKALPSFSRELVDVLTGADSGSSVLLNQPFQNRELP